MLLASSFEKHLAECVKNGDLVPWNIMVRALWLAVIVGYHSCGRAPPFFEREPLCCVYHRVGGWNGSMIDD